MLKSLLSCGSRFRRLFEHFCFIEMNVMTSKTDQLSSFHGVLITVGQKLGSESDAGGTCSPGMCKQEAPSSIHWPLDPTGSCQHGWDDSGHFFYPVDLPEKGTGKHEKLNAVTSKSKAGNLSSPVAGAPCKFEDQNSEQAKECWASTVKRLWSCFDMNLM